LSAEKKKQCPQQEPHGPVCSLLSFFRESRGHVLRKLRPSSWTLLAEDGDARSASFSETMVGGTVLRWCSRYQV